jgi:hypothetical protein
MATPNLPAFDLWDGYASTLDIYDPCWLYAGRNSNICRECSAQTG